jgi:hypothetical protein
VLEVEPLAIAGAAPLVEVLFCDGDTAIAGGDDGGDGWEGVEPWEEGGAVFSIAEAGVEAVADGGWEVGDFACAGCVQRCYLVLLGDTR